MTLLAHDVGMSQTIPTKMGVTSQRDAELEFHPSLFAGTIVRSVLHQHHHEPLIWSAYNLVFIHTLSTRL